mgnify:CR=1 FL=1
MKTIYLLFVVFIDQQGYESMQSVSDAKYDSILECKAAKSYYKESDNIKFFCGDETKYFSKHQKFY